MMDMTTLLHPERPTPRLRPIEAFFHFRRLLKDKENTEHAFHVFDALTGKSLVTDLTKFAATTDGANRIAERKYLPPLLDDHDMLKRLPSNTVGRAYLSFMEQENFTAAGLVELYETFSVDKRIYDDVAEWYNNRLRDTHDILHVLTGYGRDAVGESCIQAFSFGQNRCLAALFLGYMGALESKRVARCRVPIFGAVHQARRNGKIARMIAEEDIIILLQEPLMSARKRLKIPTPNIYYEVLETFRSENIDPYSILS